MKKHVTGDTIKVSATIRKMHKGLVSVIEIEGMKYMLDRSSIPFENTKNYEKVEIPE